MKAEMADKKQYPIKFQLLANKVMQLAPKRSSFVSFLWVGILDVPKYIRSYAPTKFSSISFVVDVHVKLPIVFPSSSRCVHTLPP
jgi:hypothetical protein